MSCLNFALPALQKIFPLNRESCFTARTAVFTFITTPLPQQAASSLFLTLVDSKAKSAFYSLFAAWSPVRASLIFPAALLIRAKECWKASQGNCAKNLAGSRLFLRASPWQNSLSFSLPSRIPTPIKISFTIPAICFSQFLFPVLQEKT